MSFEKIFEDNDILVINKPAGINSDDFPLRVHRLDKDTSGVLLIAKNESTLSDLQKQFKERKVKKKYIALIIGHLKDKLGTIETFIGRAPKNRLRQKIYISQTPNDKGKREAKTQYRLLKRFSDYDLIEVVPITGRKHQIRAHMAYINHPVAGDKVYGFKNQKNPEGLKRQFLHSNYLKIRVNNKDMDFEAKLPEELTIVLTNIEKNNHENQRI
ncbi:MAG: Pseudouridine synthase [Parcubacteria group bacterium GW2011_GWC1_38_6]|nr:MAG: Pseudouridine synthase [Parcubacteria group bacterium GW2011_GWC1_38_6]